MTNVIAQISAILQYLSGSNEFQNITILLTRVIATKSHSADVE